VAGIGQSDLFRTGAGRLRVGWRLLLFVVLLLPMYVALALLFPPTLPGSSAALLGASLGSGWALLHMEQLPPATLGLTLRRGAVRESLVGLGVGAAVALAAAGVMALAGVLFWNSAPGTLVAYAWAGALAMAFLALPAVAEEALLRGYPLQALAESWGPAPALVVTSVVFGLLHAGNPEVSVVGLLNTGLAGLFLGALYLRTGSLWWPSGAHLGWNWAHGFVLDLPVSGLDVANVPLLDGYARGPDVLSGGAFGPEGSVLTSGVLIAATAWAWNTRRLRPVSDLSDAPPMATLRVVDA